MSKNRIRLTESQLHNVIKESVKRILKEAEERDVLLHAAIAIWNSQPYASNQDIDDCVLYLDEYAKNNNLSYEEVLSRCENNPERMFQIIYHTR